MNDFGSNYEVVFSCADGKIILERSKRDSNYVSISHVHGGNKRHIGLINRAKPGLDGIATDVSDNIYQCLRQCLNSMQEVRNYNKTADVLEDLGKGLAPSPILGPDLGERVRRALSEVATVLRVSAVHPLLDLFGPVYIRPISHGTPTFEAPPPHSDEDRPASLDDEDGEGYAVIDVDFTEDGGSNE